jgi:hypothetical protein
MQRALPRLVHSAARRIIFIFPIQRKIGPLKEFISASILAEAKIDALLPEINNLELSLTL